MKTRSLLTLTVLLAAWPAGGRTFTDVEGRKLEGELVSVAGKEVKVKLDGSGRIVRLPLDRLAQKDRAEVLDWAMFRAAAKLKLSATKNRLDSVRQEKTSMGTDGIKTGSTSRDQTWQWVIKISNPTDMPVKGLRADYIQMVECTTRGAGKDPVKWSTGKLEIPEIPAFGSVTVSTETVSTQLRRAVAQSSTTGNEAAVAWDESLSGLTVSLAHSLGNVLKWGTGPQTTPAR